MKNFPIKKDWLMFCIFMFFFVLVGIRISHALIAIKNSLNYGITIRHMDAGEWEKEASKYKDIYRWRNEAGSLKALEEKGVLGSLSEYSD